MRTDTTALTVPPWLSDATSQGFETAISINTRWWETVLTEAGLAAEIPPAANGSLSRSRIFEIAAHGMHDPRVARTVLWASLAWGEGTRAFRNPARVRSFLAESDRNSDLLVQAAQLSATDPEGAYRHLNGSIKNLGPAFFTKFLYFAGAGSATHSSLILDARVATALHDHCGWESLRVGGGWPPDTFGRYCALLRRWADYLQMRGEDVTPGHLEFRLFSRR